MPARDSTRRRLKWLFWLLAIMIAVELVNLLTGRFLNQFGLIPRRLYALPGIVFSPFLHGSLQHFLSNIVPLSVFLFLTLQYGIRRFTRVSLWLVITTGLAVWIFGREAFHVGSSGLVYGYFGFLILAGILSGKVRLILISGLVAFFYAGLVFGVLPTRPFISWESHLFGFLAGLTAARIWGPSSN